MRNRSPQPRTIDVNELRRLREAKGWTRRGLADRADVSEDAINKWERGERLPRRDSLEKLCEALGCSPFDLLPSEFKRVGGNELLTVPVIAWTQAGAPEAAIQQGGWDEMVTVSYDRDTLIALEVRGDSMDRIAPEGSVIVVDYRDRDLRDGGVYLAQFEGADITVKRYRNAGGPARFEPVSTNPNHQTIFPTGPVTVLGRVRRVVTSL